MSKPEYYPRRGLVPHNLDPALPPAFHLGTLPEVGVVFDPVAGHTHDGIDAALLAVHGAARHTDRQRHIFFPVPSTPGDNPSWFRSGSGYHGGYRLQDAFLISMMMEAKLPADFVSIVHLHAVVGSEGTGNMVWSLDTDFAANGEAHDTHTAGSGVLTTAVTVNLITELPNLSAILAGVTGDDYIGLGFVRDGANVNDTVNDDVILLGYLVEYTADM